MILVAVKWTAVTTLSLCAHGIPATDNVTKQES